MATHTHPHTLCFEDAYSKSRMVYIIISFCCFNAPNGPIRFICSGTEQRNNQTKQRNNSLDFSICLQDNFSEIGKKLNNSTI